MLVFSEIWRSAGWDSLLYLAAIIGIDQALYEAAEIDGANRWQKIRYVTIPGHRADDRDALHPQYGHVPQRRPQPGHQLPQRRRCCGQIDIIDTYVYRIGSATGRILAGDGGRPVQGGARHGPDVSARTSLSKRLTGKGVW